jgi:hypothetical protein
MVGMIEPRRLISGQNLVGTSFQVHFAACRNGFVRGANWFQGFSRIQHTVRGGWRALDLPLLTRFRPVDNVDSVQFRRAGLARIHNCLAAPT